MIYIHVPFCRSFCTYCDFYSEIVGGCRRAEGDLTRKGGKTCSPPGFEAGVNTKKAGNVLGPRAEDSVFRQYCDDLCAEIEARRDEILSTLGVSTLYIGGGTPSVLPLECLRRIVEKLDSVIREGEDAGESDTGATGAAPGRNGVKDAGAAFRTRYEEFTVEVNPEDIVEKGPEYVRGLLELRVNRISMGVQSLDPGMLRWMNRRHSADGARQAWRIISDAAREEAARSVDLISGVPGMSLRMLEATVDEVLEWRPEHISAYQLSIEEGSALAKQIAAGKVSELPDEECRAQYELLCSKLREAGYHHYEISNWALSGHEAVHNSAYWTRQPYVGLGPGAHSLEVHLRKRPETCVAPIPNGGLLTKTAQNVSTPGQIRKWNSKSPTGWKEEGREVLTPEEIREEELMLTARTDRGPIPESDWFIADELVADLI
ncbi:MAG: coproporphyrinogen III oxidase family protein [Bacteroidales bacterium]|nr:coproporphyrinogen III oxidase family protein [Bacteroidales bacterium]